MRADAPWRRKYGSYLFAGLLSLFCAFPSRAAAAPILRQDEITTLNRADVLFDNARKPPTRRGVTRTLPDNWKKNNPNMSCIAWYRLRFNLTQLPEQPLALYLPHLSVVGEIWLNDSLLNPNVHFGTGGRHPVAMSDEPIYIVLPAGLFHVGNNVLSIRLQGDSAMRSGLSQIYLGPAITLHRIWFHRYLLQVIVSYIMLVLIIGALCFLLAYAWQQRRFFTIQFALVLSLLTLLIYLMDLRISLGDQQALRAIVSTAMYWALCLAGYRMAGIKLRWYPPLLHSVTAATLLAMLALMLMGDATDRIWLITWPHVAIRLVPIALLLHQGWQSRSMKIFLLGLTALLWNITVAQSYFIIMDWLPWDSFRLSFAGALPFSLVMIYHFAERFIADREGNLREQRAAIVAERTRILQDMHDGMGAQLITALRLARRNDTDRRELARHIEESLQDLRLIIDSLDITEHDLLPLLGNLRFRLEPQLHALGIALAWDVSPIPALPYLTPASALSVLRIVQEAVNNALQHAQPGQITLSVRQEDDVIAIRIADDGCGLIPTVRHPGSRGLSGMQTRANDLRARLDIRGDDQGTVVSLLLPLHAKG
ncbi:sensor histidine kinase [Martelella alba]|uniref:histidine kinase n=1 Tax=Martelella alba TaxID=2590451 RepID=A0ABY2SP19_9HYPH|nr:ATP-binding protein [Martelella alba]TKI07733.1 hypothetical protein FCN80_04615 [Martelella alba]